MKKIIYAVSFPKSGRTWIELMTAKVRADITGEPIIGFLERQRISSKLRQGYKKRKNRLYGFLFSKKYHYLPTDIIFSHGYKNPEICKGKTFPENYYKNQNIFLLVRDPRDVIVSHYKYEKYFYKRFAGDLSEFIRYSEVNSNDYKVRYGIQAIINYMNAWIEHKSIFKNFYIGYYENFRKNTLLEFSRLCNYFELDASDKIIKEAVDFGSFENMRKIELRGEIDWHGFNNAKINKNNINVDELKTRKGKVGGYLDELKQFDIEYITSILHEKLNDVYSIYK